jgi:hypothetical protein
MEVFVYGTLTDPDRVAAVLDDWSFGPDGDPPPLAELVELIAAGCTVVPTLE